MQSSSSKDLKYTCLNLQTIKEFISGELNQSREDIAKLREETSRVQNRRQQMSKLVTALSSECKSIDRQLERLDPIEKEAQKNKTRIEALRKELEKLQAERQKRDGVHKTEILIINREIEDLKKKEQTNPEVIKDRVKNEFRSQIEELEKKARAYHAKSSEIEEQLTNMDGLIQAEKQLTYARVAREFTEKKKRLEDDVKKAKNKLENAKFEYEGMKSAMNEEFEAEIAQLKRELEQIQEERDLLNQQ